MKLSEGRVLSAPHVVVRREQALGKTAAQNTRQLILDIGEEYKDGSYPWGWKAYVARRMGISETTVQWLLNGRIKSLGLRALQKISNKTRCPVEVLTERQSA